MKKHRETFHPLTYLLFAAATLLVLVVSVAVGSVNVPFGDVVTVIWNSIWGLEIPASLSKSVILYSRLPRVLCAGFMGAALSLCGAAMQGLLRNPLADGSTMGVSSGASLGACLAIAFGVTIPGFGNSGVMVTAVVFAFGSLLLILGLAYKLDYSLATNTIILIGVIFSMFAGSVLNLITAYAGDRVKDIVHWTMGSLTGKDFSDVLVLLAALIVCGAVILSLSRELNAFAIGEDNARNVGVNVRRVKLCVLIAVSALIGICVSIGGSIGFVGLVMPHITRMLTGPNHKRLLPASLFSGAMFLMLADMVSRVLIRPLELPVGAVTSLIGSVVFVVIFYRSRKGK